MTTKIHGLRWYILLLVALGGVVNYVDRNVLAVLAPELEKVLHFSTQQYSYIVVAFLLFYSLTQPVAGYIIDRIGLRLGYFVFALLWGVSARSPRLRGELADHGGLPRVARRRSVGKHSIDRQDRSPLVPGKGAVSGDRLGEYR